MVPNSPEPNGPQPGALQSMLARLRGMVQALKTPETEAPRSAEVLPTWDTPEGKTGSAAIASLTDPVSADGQSGAEPAFNEVVPAAEVIPADLLLEEQVAAGEPVPSIDSESVPPVEPDETAPSAETEQPSPSDMPEQPAEGQQSAVSLPPGLTCPVCQSPRQPTHSYCGECGFVFPPPTELELPTMPAVPSPCGRLKGRYELGAPISERGEVGRFHGTDYGEGSSPALPVVLVRAQVPATAEPVIAEAVDLPNTALHTDESTTEYGEILPSFEDPMADTIHVARAAIALPAWPSIAWEKDLLLAISHPTLPRVLDAFVEDGWEYLVEEAPTGLSLWDAWDDPRASAEQRFGWLKQIAEGLRQLHKGSAILEALRPDIITVTSTGQAMLNDLSGLLPVPLPPDAPLRATLFSAPELIVSADQADSRADLYSFGAMLYALHVGRELSDMDFERQGTPKPFIPRFPDVHPLFGRLVSKTFCRDLNGRFPSDEAVKEDGTGFTELIRTLDTCRRTLDNVRLEIAAWTTTGMVRTGNEDAFALLHAIESRQDDMGEAALVLLADGMGGYEAGEVAAALAIQHLRKNLLQQPQFAGLAGNAFADQPPFDLETCKQAIRGALKEANKHVFTASRSGVGKRGMGCTAEVVYVNGRHVLVGHVGDSRIYHLHEGLLAQLTRDQTLVNRLVELGTLTPEEAETHPRRSELQQAIGGHGDVEPGMYHGAMKPGDWVIVCSDGLSNHVKPDDLQQMLQGEATSAEMAARRLVNFANIMGATDNATVVVIRAT